MTTRASSIRLAPKRAAEKLAKEHAKDPEWLDAFTDALDTHRQSNALERILEVWGLSRSEAGRQFGVSRQAVAKWLSGGLPADRFNAVADLSAATDLLVHHIKRDRVAAVVRRPIPAADGVTLLEMLGAGRYRDVLTTCRQMFDFARSQG